MTEEFYKHTAVCKCLDDIQPFTLLDKPLPAVSVQQLLNIVFAQESEDISLKVVCGRLVGAVNKKSVKLPVYNPALYNINDESYTSGQIVFDKVLQEGVANAAIAHIMELVRNRESLKFNLVDRQLVCCEFENGVKQFKEIGRATRLVKEHILDTAIIYRRSESDIQLKFNVVQTLDHPLYEVEKNLDIMFAKTADGGYDSQIKKQDYELHVIDIHLVDDVGLSWEVLCKLYKGIDEDGEANDLCEITFGLSSVTLRALKAAYREAGALALSVVSSLDTLFIYNSLLLLNFSTESIYRDQGLFYPMVFGDSAADVKRHYNLKKIALAGESAIEIVRTTNNEIKRLLIDEYVAQRAAVLDLACGHGQDILKYLEKDLKVFIGIDFSSQEIREARRRAQKPSLAHLPFRFHVGNMLIPESYEKFLSSQGVFDVVSVQLAIHYTLSSEEAATMILESIARRLKPGGIFIGSCPSSFAIADRMKVQMARDSESNFVFGNSVYNVTFALNSMNLYQKQPEFVDEFSVKSVVLPGEQSIPKWITDHQQMEPLRSQILLGMGTEKDRQAHTLIESDPTNYLLNEMWGVPYHFWLIDHIDAQEFVVPWRAFCRVARKCGLNCILTMPFDQYLEHLRKNNHPQACRFANQHEHMLQKSRTAEMQMEVVSIYQVFAFQKDASGVTDARDLAAQPPALSIVTRTQRA